MAEKDGGIAIARITRAFGIRGEVTAEILTDFPERFDDVTSVSLRRPGHERTAELERHRFHKGRVLLKFAGIDTMNDAETLVGLTVEVPADELHQLPDDGDQYYDFDLIGCAVTSVDGESIGIVESVVRGGAGELLSVRRSSGKEVLVPFVDGICVDVDTSAKRITVDLPVGLLDL